MTKRQFTEEGISLSLEDERKYHQGKAIWIAVAVYEEPVEVDIADTSANAEIL
ncbi:MAG: hypothetical protein ACLRMZ_00520 [Blautia marasmi]